jgi:hypothetical protein
MHKKFLGFSLLLSCLMLGVIGCPAKNPTSPAATPTPVPTVPAVWSFEGSGSGNSQGWTLGYGPGTSVAVTAFGYQSSYGLSLDFVGTSGDNDGQPIVSGAAQGFPVDFTTLNASGVYCYIYIPTTAYTSGNTQYSVAFCPFINTAPVTVSSVAVSQFGGCYGGWTSANAQYGPNGTGGNWALTSLSPPDTTYWPTAKTDVMSIGIEVNLATAVAANFVIDDVTIY